MKENIHAAMRARRIALRLSQSIRPSIMAGSTSLSRRLPARRAGSHASSPASKAASDRSGIVSSRARAKAARVRNDLDAVRTQLWISNHLEPMKQ